MTLVDYRVVEARLEQAFPFAVGAIASVLCLAWGDEAIGAMDGAGWNVGAIYSSVFDVSAIFTPFAFTFFTLFVTTDRGFIGKAKGTLPYKRTVEYTLTAMLLGGLLTVTSIPMLIVVPKPTDFSLALLAVSAWLGLTTWTAAAFARAAYIFSIFAREHL